MKCWPNWPGIAAGNADWNGLTKIELACGYKDNLSNYYVENPSHILGDLEKYEVYLSKERRKREGLKVTGSLALVNDRLPDLINQLEPIYESGKSKPVLKPVVGFADKSKANLSELSKGELIELCDQLDSMSSELKSIVNMLQSAA